MTTFSRRRILLAGISVAALGFGLSACSDKDKQALNFRGNNIGGSHLGSKLAMSDTDGKLRTIKDFEGKVLLVYFGYTQCPDVCPTALAELSLALESLGDKAKDVQVAMITVDPERDTAEILRAYLDAFDPSFMGLVDTPEQLHQTARSFKAFYAKEPGSSPQHYAMNHSSAFYLFDRNGEARVLLGPSLTPDDMAHDINLLL